MPITYELRPDDRVVVFVHSGTVPDDEFISFYKTFFENTQFDKSFNLLVDLRQTDSSIRSTEALQQFAEYILQHYANIADRPKIAVVAPEDIAFGLARMYEAFSGLVPWEFVVFRTAESALAWLGLPENLLEAHD